MLLYVHIYSGNGQPRSGWPCEGISQGVRQSGGEQFIGWEVLRIVGGVGGVRMFQLSGVHAWPNTHRGCVCLLGLLCNVCVMFGSIRWWL